MDTAQESMPCDHNEYQKGTDAGLWIPPPVLVRFAGQRCLLTINNLNLTIWNLIPKCNRRQPHVASQSRRDSGQCGRVVTGPAVGS